MKPMEQRKDSDGSKYFIQIHFSVFSMKLDHHLWMITQKCIYTHPKIKLDIDFQNLITKLVDKIQADKESRGHLWETIINMHRGICVT